MASRYAFERSLRGYPRPLEATVWNLRARTTWGVPFCRACTARVARAWCSPAGRSPAWFSQCRHRALVSTGQLAADGRLCPYEAHLVGRLDGACWIACTLRPTRPGCWPLPVGCRRKSRETEKQHSLGQRRLMPFRGYTNVMKHGSSRDEMRSGTVTGCSAGLRKPTKLT